MVKAKKTRRRSRSTSRSETRSGSETSGWSNISSSPSNVSSSSSSSSNEILERTYQSLHEWYKHTFTHLGWMVLADAHGYQDKINCYKNSIKRLHQSIEQKIQTIKEIDRKNDLKIMLKNVKILQKHVEQDFAN